MDEKTRLLKMLRNSKTLKEKAGWSREIGAGFVAEDIVDLTRDKEDKVIHFTFGWGAMSIDIAKLSLRETEETIKYLENLKLGKLDKPEKI